MNEAQAIGSKKVGNPGKRRGTVEPKIQNQSNQVGPESRDGEVIGWEGGGKPII